VEDWNDWSPARTLPLPVPFSPDGKLLALNVFNPVTQRDIWMLQLSAHKEEPFLRTPFNETAPRFSPDGHWLAYASDESGRYEIYVQPYPGLGESGRSRPTGERRPYGIPRGGSFSTAAATK